MLVYTLLLAWFDRYEKEPLALLAAAFLWGAGPAVVFSLIAELVLNAPISYFAEPTTATLLGSTLAGPVVEEAFKGLALFALVVFFGREIDSPLDGILYGGLVGFGFAAVENLLYLGSTLASEGAAGVLALGVLRACIFGLNHAFFTGLTGAGIALGRSSRNWLGRIGAPVGGLALGALAHIVHNGSVTLGEEYVWPCLIALLSDWGGIFILLVVIVGSMLKERSWIVTYLADEVGRGTLSSESYEIVSSSFRRVIQRLSLFLRGDLRGWWDLGRYYQLLTELAFKKHRLSRFPKEETTAARIGRLRQRVAALGAQVGKARG